MVLPLVLASILTGILTSRIGYYTPFLIFGICVTAVGAGLLNTLGINTLVGQWIGYQILYGFGFGSSAQAPNMAAQTVLSRNEASIGVSLMLFAQTLFGAIFVSIGNVILDNELAKRLAGIPGITPRLIQSSGATGLLKLIPAEYYTTTLEAYNDSLRVCFQVGLIMACLSILGALGMEWRSVKKNLPPKNPEGERAAEEGKDEGDLSKKAAVENTTEKNEQKNKETTETEKAEANDVAA
jgi:MFS family permease